MEIILKSKNKNFDVINDNYASMELTIEKYLIKYPFSRNIFSNFQKKVLCSHCDVSYNFVYQKLSPIFYINCSRKIDISDISNTKNIYARISNQNLEKDGTFITAEDNLPKTLNLVDSLYDFKNYETYIGSGMILKQEVIGGWVQIDSYLYPSPALLSSNSTNYLLFQKRKLLCVSIDKDLDTYVPHLEFTDVPTFLFKEEEEAKESLFFSLDLFKRDTGSEGWFQRNVLRSPVTFLKIHLYFDFVFKTDDLYEIYKQIKN